MPDIVDGVRSTAYIALWIQLNMAVICARSDKKCHIRQNRRKFTILVSTTGFSVKPDIVVNRQ